MPIIYAQKVYHATKNKAGQAYVGKNGRPFVRVSIKDNDGIYWNMLDFNGLAANWTDGQTVDTDALNLTVTETEYNGVKQFNLEAPKGAVQSDIESRLAKVEQRVNAMAQFLHEKFPNPNQNE